MIDEIKDVNASVWISASAGTGKTKSLIDRILALLLNKADPAKILCLTYTKAAATEMLNRLSDKIQQFSQMPDTLLIQELKHLGFDETYLQISKTLYSKSLISADWVKIQTIHSFCFSILKKFPIETGLMPGITLCDDYQRKKLLHQSIETVLFREDCRQFSEYISQFTTDITEFFQQHTIKLQKFTSKFNEFDLLYRDFFGIKENEKLFDKNLDQSLIKQIFGEQYKQIFQQLADVLSTGKKEDNKKAAILYENIANPSPNFVYAFLTNELQIRSSLCSTTILKSYPKFQEKMLETAKKAIEFCKVKNTYVSAAANISLFYLINKILDKFNQLKRLNHCLDFDDIISLTSGLLNNIEWVMYKIDNSIDHILIDEAQDTSPEQWDIINIITDEFFANYGSSKTVFVVGDEKQSIYSFQGADVKIFKNIHDKFEARSIANGQKFHNVNLNKSYRSSGNILSFVDDIFKNTTHDTNRSKFSGVIDIVDLFEDTTTSIPETNIYNTVLPPITAEKTMAEYIANFIKQTIDSQILVESKNRSAEPSDFMILFQRRDTNAMGEIIKSLRKQKIPVSGIDRMLLKDEIIVEDCLVFAKFALLPQDDLTCARFLKSPIIGISEEELMQLCLKRTNMNLWEYALNNNEISQKYNLQYINQIIMQVNQMSAYDFFSEILINGMKEKFISRLGTKCLEPLYNFIDIVITYEKENTPSLQNFLQWFRDNDIEIKYDSFNNENCVRLMTVHGSKGLQSPFVILADTHFYKTKNDKIIQNENGIMFWNISSNTITEKLSDLCKIYNQYETEESKRRLYVALTRAEDYVCILGLQQKNRRSNCWYDLIYSQINTNKFKKISINNQYVLRFGDFSFTQKTKKYETEKKISIKIPNWLNEKLELPTSNISEPQIKNDNMIYGDCVHLLLSELPQYDLSTYDIFADAIISRFNLSDLQKLKAKEESYNILRNKNFSFIFDQKSLSEITFIENGKENRIDKIAFLNNEIWIIDFKTGEYHHQIPQIYINQLTKYKKSLSKMYQDKNIRTAILWTSANKLDEITIQHD
ncbi:MAG: UvrD-helicase domain-containing protein [Alphaproteobacteria bacterium]|nr:UvrD-helicase domain-containing protein [Alphaproteobacteria bacterium]